MVYNDLAAITFCFPFPQGEGIYSFVVLKEGAEYSQAMYRDFVEQIRSTIGPIATPDVIHIVAELPKTRSGKIMRRILRKVAAGEKNLGALGDVSTLADSSVVQALIDSRAHYLPAGHPDKSK